MAKKNKFIGLRISDELYRQQLENVANQSEVIRLALESYQSKEFFEKLKNGFTQFNELFKEISEHFKSGRTTISVDEFMKIAKKELDFELIDQLIKEVKNDG